MPGCSVGGEGCLEDDRSSLVLDVVTGRARAKLDCVRVILPTVLVGVRPRRFFVGVGGFLIFERLEGGRGAGTEDVEGWCVASLDGLL